MIDEANRQNEILRRGGGGGLDRIVRRYNLPLDAARLLVAGGQLPAADDWTHTFVEEGQAHHYARSKKKRRCGDDDMDRQFQELYGWYGCTTAVTADASNASAASPAALVPPPPPASITDQSWERARKAYTQLRQLHHQSGTGLADAYAGTLEFESVAHIFRELDRLVAAGGGGRPLLELTFMDIGSHTHTHTSPSSSRTHSLTHTGLAMDVLSLQHSRFLLEPLVLSTRQTVSTPLHRPLRCGRVGLRCRTVL